MGLSLPAWREARDTIQKLLSENESLLQDDVVLRKK